MKRTLQAEKIKMPTLDCAREDIGQRLDSFLAENEEITRSLAQKLIDGGFVTVNGLKVKKNYLMRTGDTVNVEYPPSVPCEAQPENIPLDIIYEDDELIVINKPKGMVVHPAAGNFTGTLVSALLYHCGSSLSGICGVIRPGIVHRIDKDTSGLLVCAKNDASHLFLSSQLKDHSLCRVYQAIAIGRISDSITIDKPIGRSPSDRKKMAVTADGRAAVTHIEPLEFYKGATYVKCRLETGRTHQIRVHLSSVGHPILGDMLYGLPKSPLDKRFSNKTCGQCLHAGELSFIHPKTKERVTFYAPLPDYFTEILNCLRSEAETD